MSEKTLDTNKMAAPTIDVLVPGIQTTIQDYPGRRGYWNIGVPPSGPMDNLAFRLANRLAGNEEGQAAIEITLPVAPGAHQLYTHYCRGRCTC
ncbi:MAG: hypothetical protein P0107_02790 [Nitrosomonas sp.]|nr:hypothetical protein [Nitrosomonas sp.]